MVSSARFVAIRKLTSYTSAARQLDPTSLRELFVFNIFGFSPLRHSRSSILHLPIALKVQY